ncbi:MAG: alpha-amylase family glycosyl hydrolase, partial [Ignavibacteria bacterium]|nr:alpha-amylase family glycosyl hydrolase [Ignavibacteria bacterium]
MNKISLKIAIIILCFLTSTLSLFAKDQEIVRVEPPFWWAGMEHNELQLMIYGKDISNAVVTINYPGVELKETIKAENQNYVFLNLHISKDVKPGKFPITFASGRKKLFSYTYELRERKAGSAQRQGFNNSDVVYLLMPDRFSNGDPKNDNMPGMLELADRSNPNGRHGGDLKGISDKLDYFNDLGVTALWLNPVLENNMPAITYHGYAITDFYKVDSRFGTNEDYRLLIENANKKGLRVIMDMVFNHFGTNHWWMNDLPMKNWINQWTEYTKSNYRGGTITDPYASDFDKKLMLKGWFDKTMADFNQENEFVAKYLIQ